MLNDNQEGQKALEMKNVTWDAYVNFVRTCYSEKSCDFFPPYKVVFYYK